MAPASSPTKVLRRSPLLRKTTMQPTILLQVKRIRLAVTESSSIAFAYVLDDSQLVEEPNAAPIALIYRNDEGVFITLDLLPDEQQLVMPKRSTAAMITGGEVCAAALAGGRSKPVAVDRCRGQPARRVAEG